MMEIYLTLGIVCFIVGIFVGWKLNKPKIDTDLATTYLNEQGYTVHIRK